MGVRLSFGVLGPLTVADDGVALEVPGHRRRVLLARLLVDVGNVVPATLLMEQIWGPKGHSRSTGPLRTTVWELRRLLQRQGATNGAGPSPEVLLARDGGYVLDVDQEQVDSRRFEARLAQGRAWARSTRPERGLASVDEALRLWRGPAYSDLAGEAALRGEAARLDQVVLDARELRAELLLALGRHAEVDSDLRALARANPERERTWVLLMTALYRLGRQADALRTYQEARQRLIDAVGIEPGPELRQTERSILDQDPALLWHPPTSPTPPEPGPASSPGDPEHAPPGTTPLATGPGALPHPPTSFVGRRTERRAVAELLVGSRLLALVGPGGCGKTRLAVAVAHDVRPRFPGGVHFVDLSTISEGDELTGAVASILDAATSPSGPSPPGAGDLDAPDESLLILDSCEHVIDAVASYVAAELERSPWRRILVTSREELRLRGETVCRLSGLSLPPHDGPGACPGSEAVELFAARATAALPAFVLRGDTLELVARICRRVDGLPLAIELAASLVGSLPVAEIARRLDQHLGLLTETDRTSVPRHRSLQATLDWSFGLLGPASQALLARLGAFSGTFTLAAADAVAGPGADTAPVAQGLAQLARASMVEPVTGPDGVGRYRMLETIRHYAGQELEKLPDAASVRRRHAVYYSELVADTGKELLGPPTQLWLRDVKTELPNLRVALKWAMAHDDVEIVSRLVASLRWSLSRVVALADVSEWLRSTLKGRAQLPPLQRLRLLTAASVVAYQRGDLAQVALVSGEAVDLARRLGQHQQLAAALLVSSAAAVHAGKVDEGRELVDEAEALCQRLGDRWGLGWCCSCRALVAFASGQEDAARQQQEQALAVFRAVDDPHSQVAALVALAVQAAGSSDAGKGCRLASEAVQLAYDAECRSAQHLALGALGTAELMAGHPGRARTLLLRSLRDFPDSRNLRMMVGGFEALAWLALRDWQDAVAMLGFAAQMARRHEIPASPPARAATNAILAHLRQHHGPELVEEQLARGRRISLAEALRLAEASTSPPTA